MKKTSNESPDDYPTYKGVNFLVQKDGKIFLHPKRIEKLEKGLKKLDNAEQYVLKCVKADKYDCFHCAAFFYSDKKISLAKENVWRYGPKMVKLLLWWLTI